MRLFGLIDGTVGPEDAILIPPFDRSPAGTTGTRTNILTIGWSDGSSSLSGAILHFGDTQLQLVYTVAPNSTQSVSVPILCSPGGVALSLFYMVAPAFLTDVGPLSVSFVQSTCTFTVLLLPNTPFVWSAIQPAGDFITGPVSTVVFTNPNSTSADVKIQALASS